MKLENYSPINTLKPVVDNLWIVDGPLIRFGMPWPKIPFTTRMTIIRLKGGGLFIHSPTPLTDSLKQEIDELGEPKYIIGPNRIHYWWVPEWKEAYPNAEVYLAPRIEEQGKDRIEGLVFKEFSGNRGYPWDAEIYTLPVAGSYMTEVEFFHIESQTLILTDVIENFEPEKIHGWFLKLATKMAGVQAPHGSMPKDMRFTFSKQREELKKAVEKMISWEPKRIIIAHGKWFEKDGAEVLRRSFDWVLK